MRSVVDADIRARGRPGRDDADLEAALRAAQAGDQVGFEMLYRRLQPGLLRYAAALVGPEAEDATAETWLHVARDVRSFVGDIDGFRGWVSTICRNRAIDLARRRARRNTEPLDANDLVALTDRQNVSDSALGSLATQWAMDRILELPRTEAEAVLLRAVIGLDAVTAGRVLGKRPGAVRVAAHRGLRRLARIIEDDGWTASDEDT